MARKMKPIKDRFSTKYRIDEHTGCWIWTSTTNNAGYGTIGLGTAEQGKDFAHRASYRIFKGPIEKGCVICHKCDNKKCVNPDHLFMGTQLDNIRDAQKKGRIRKGDAWKTEARLLIDQKGEKHGMHKLKEHEVREILIRKKAGPMVIAHVAAEFRVTRGTIRNIITRKNWKHVVV
jgi:hypothetical protein